MRGEAGNDGGGGDTQVLDGGTPPLGSPSSDGDGTQRKADDWALYDETQPLDDAETQLIDEVVEEEEGVAGDWTETQLVEGGDDGDQVKTQQEMEDGEGGDVGGGAEDNAGNCTQAQLVEECEVDGVNTVVGDMVETQLVEESEEDDKDGLNDDDEHDPGELGKTQLVENSDEDIGDDELSDGTVVLSDNESLSEDERGMESGMDKRDAKLGMEGSIEGLNGGIKKHDDNNNLVDSDASTDEEGDTDSGHLQLKLPSVRVASVRTCGISEPRDTNHDKGGGKSRDKCSTAKKLFADTAAEDGENNSRCLAGLSYVGSQEPGDLSQANAFDVVDRLISIKGGLSSQENTPNKLEKEKPRVSSKRGTLMLAEKVDLGRGSNTKAEIFEFVDSREDDGGGDFFSKNKDIFLLKPIGRGKPKSHSTRAKKSSTKKSRGENKIGEAMNKRNTKLSGRFETIPLSDSRLFKSDVKSKRASGNRTKKNLLKDLDDLSNAKSLEEQERADVALNDVGPDTQMAVEAMEALVQCSPAKSLSAEGQPLFNRDKRAEKFRITKSHSKNDSPQRTSNIQEGVTTRSKRRKVTDFSTKPQKERLRGSKMQESSEPIVKVKHKQTKSVPEKSKVSKKFIDENKNHGTPVAHRTRHCGRNDPSAFIELSNKHLRRVKKLTGDSSTIGQVQNNHIATKSGLSCFEKESTEQTCTNNDQDLQQSRDGSAHRTSVNNVQNLEAHRVEPTTDVTCRDSPSHPKRRRTPTKMIQSTAAASANHEIPSEVARPCKKRRIFIRSVSDLLKYAKREPSHGRSASMMSNIIEKSLAASPVLNSSVRDDRKTSSDVISSAQRLKESSHVEDTSKSPKNNPQVPNSAMKIPSKVVNELSPTFSPVNPSKGSSRSLSKASIARELLKLDPENVLSNQQRKDSRRRKDMANVSILFSHHLDDDVIKRQKKILARLGVCEAFSMADATHFVADRFCRTKNMLEAITLGKPGKRVFVTSNVKPSQVVVTSLVKASSGQPLERLGRSIMKEKEVPPDLLVLSCEEDYGTCAPLLEKGASVFSVEFLLNGIVIQKLEYER
ncbi:unnamed protein product [Miscanthus lutarioriparius]|uniref:BRCT domain-containing protein n=1 Tax=Miscanthus lutarioriparius TaxID=422564 RepID=A0A811RZZ3_9POAL|nr:unnamed protein product [Miscanthus lutarioriparius]